MGHERSNPSIIPALDEAFRQLTTTLYDTRVSAEVMAREVTPHLADDVTFTDPWQTGKGKDAYRLGMAGFHAMFHFEFEFHQVNVQLNEAGDRGRAIVDGVMQLRQFSWLYVYPLRTILVYDFILPKAEEPGSFLVTAHEEMWSFGDMIEAVPLLGRAYAKLFRPAFARGFLAASRLAIKAQQKRAGR